MNDDITKIIKKLKRFVMAKILIQKKGWKKNLKSSRKKRSR